MNLVTLPVDLQDLVVQFAYEIKLKDLKKDLTVITEVKSWNLHPSFIRGRVWCDRMWGLVSNPLDVYLPLTWFQDRFVFFDMGLVDEVLGRLDFRKKDVRSMGSRWDWVIYLQEWEFMGLFAVFFRIMQENPCNMKPNWCGLSLI